MKKIYGEYFNCGYAVTSDSHGIVLDGIAVDQFQKWIDVETKYSIFGIYPQDIQGGEKNGGKEIQLDVKKVVHANYETYFACVEWQMGWYLFYKFAKEDVIKLSS